MSRYSERNREAYELGFTGKSGGESGAYESRLRYHKSDDFKDRYDDIKLHKSENPEQWRGISERDIINGIDAAEFVHPLRDGLEKFVHNWEIAKEIWPNLDNNEIAKNLLDNDLLDEMRDAGFGDFWYH